VKFDLKPNVIAVAYDFPASSRFGTSFFEERYFLERYFDHQSSFIFDAKLNMNVIIDRKGVIPI